MLTALSMFLTALFALGHGQTAYLNVLAIPLPSATALRTGPPPLCDLTLSFFDGQSNLLKSTEVMITPGGSASLSLGSGEIKTTGKGPAMVYGEVALLDDSDTSCQLLNVLQLTDPNGRTETLTPLFGGGRLGPAS